MKRTPIQHFSSALLTGLVLTCQIVSAQSVDFIKPLNGEVVSSPFKVVFGLTGMAIAPAGDMTQNTGHHHLLINKQSIAEGTVIPADESHRHFGKGQTETEVTLTPGRYQLTMQFANGAHQSYGEKLSKSIEITVK